ncbi:MAG: DUF3989 domain-containing protein [Alistipes sp.]|nr:DUF3989 domain-containing protein [Alistipes sp.]
MKYIISIIEQRLRRVCHSLPQGQRPLIVVVMLMLFAAVAIYVSISAFCDVWHGRSQFSIEHIQPLGITPQGDSTTYNTPTKNGTRQYEYSADGGA